MTPDESSVTVVVTGFGQPGGHRMSAPGQHHHHVVADVDMRLLGVGNDEVSVAAEFHYSTRDPYAVQVTFRRGTHEPVVWVFARELLLVGAARSVGDGDVRVEPQGDEVVISLVSPEGSARLAANAAEIRRFATQMLAVVSAGDEGKFVDIDAELASLNPAEFARDDA